MFSAIRRRMTWANVAMTLALVFAMSGGAYAAKKFIITNTKQISPKVLAQLKGAKGPAGPAGAQGPAGQAGPQGPAGANGKDGLAGKDGLEGKAGANGKSVVAEPATVAECKEGGTAFEVEGSGAPAHVCNGEKGVLHAGETLPSGATETGAWGGVSAALGSGFVLFSPISFNIELAAGLDSAHTLKPGDAEFASKCTGTAAAPTAAAGYLCVYKGSNGGTVTGVDNPGTGFGVGAAKTGAVIQVSFTGAGEFAWGTWAVTAA